MSVLTPRVLDLQGSPRERGLQHGSQLADGIQAMLRSWCGHVGPRRFPQAEYLARFSQSHRFLAAMQSHAPHLVAELEGIATGAGVPFQAILDLQLLDEEWWYRHAYAGGIDPAAHHCSALAGRTPDGKVVVAQNFDGVSWMAGHQCLFRHRDPGSGLDALVFSLPGMLALNGVNAAGVAVCVNSLVQLDGSLSGLPVMAVIRLLLESRDFPAARRLLEDLPHASGQNYVIGDRNAFGAFEASAVSVHECPGTAAGRPVWHTNHPLVNRDQSIHARATKTWSAARIVAASANSSARMSCLARHLADRATLTVDSIKQLLSSREDAMHPLSRVLGAGGTDQVIDYTAACTIFELGERVVMHYAPGPPCGTPFWSIDVGKAGTTCKPS